MKFRYLILPIFAVLITALSSLVTYQVFSYSESSPPPLADNPSLTLNLPDQQYVISQRDLDRGDKQLVIPSRDNATPKIVYNSQSGTLESLTTPQDYVIDLDLLRSLVSSNLSESSLTFTPPYTLQDRYTTSLAQFNSHLNRVHRFPLNITLKDGSEMVDLTLDPSLLRQFIRPISTDLLYPIDLDQDALVKHILSVLTPKQKKYFDGPTAYQNTKNALNLRFMGNETPVVLGVDDGPTSHGEKADKYLEVDLSQQKMYFFIDQTLYKEYKVSTGIDYPTPVGEFHILNKEPKAFSRIYNVWMPYWMAFKYAGDVGAYLGLHEIAYTIDQKGMPFYKHGYYIGDMMTGGCVAMEPKDSREIYNLADVGMLIRVVK